ncbi:MAG: DUF2624 family protein [Bacilli bacterium]|nr:DUF2624 family protein [Bacilli bacterium]
MNEFMLNKYIDKLTVTHIKEYAKNQGIILKNNEDEIIYDFIKNNYMKLYKEDYNENIIKELKCSLSFNTYEKVNLLYKEAKEKIK